MVLANLLRGLCLSAAASLATVACRTIVSTSAPKDVATNSTPAAVAGGTYLYFRDGSSVARTRCPDQALLYDRQHCADGLATVSFKAFVDALAVGVGASINGHAQNVQELFAGIAKIDDKLLELLTLPPTLAAQVQALKVKLNDLEAQIGAKQAKLSDLTQQLTAIRARLALQPDADLTVQLSLMMDERTAALTALNQVKAVEQAARQDFIAMNSTLLDTSTFADIKLQEQAYVQKLTSEQAALAAAMQEVSDLNKTILQLGDQTFTYNVLEGQPAFAGMKAYTRQFPAAFAAAQSADVSRPVAPQVGTGLAFTCLLDYTGVHCWGKTDDGQTTVPPLKHPRLLATGMFHACALDDGGVKCWGRNDKGQATPPPLNQPTAIAAGGDFTCALEQSGVKCWGTSENGQTQVPALVHPTQVSAGALHACALDQGGVKCWGLNVAGATTVPPLTNPVQISAGTAHTCALDQSGVVCWGSDHTGQTDVPHLASPRQVSAGTLNTCALTDAGVICWGDNSGGQVNVPPLHNPAQVSAGGGQICAIDQGGLSCWGVGSAGAVQIPLAPPGSER